MPRITIKNLKSKYNKKLRQIKEEIWLKCAECSGFFLDGYKRCSEKSCQLFKFFPRKNTVSSTKFKILLAKYAEKTDNNEDIVKIILPKKRGRPKNKKRK